MRVFKYFLVSCLLALSYAVSGAELSPSLKSLQGKWSGSHTRDGARFTFALEVKGDKLMFQAKNADGETRFAAKGTLKTDKTGPLNVLTLSDIRAGRSEDDLREVDHSRTSIFVVRDDKLLIASNFDREVENEPPRVDEYSRVAESAKAGPDTSATLAGTWNMDLNLADQNFDYKLRVEKDRDEWKTTFISPRSGEHKAKSTTLKGNELEIVIDRQIQDNTATFVYKGKLAASKISGTVTVKGLEDQFTGTWTASR